MRLIELCSYNSPTVWTGFYHCKQVLGIDYLSEKRLAMMVIPYLKAVQSCEEQGAVFLHKQL